jgi:nucleotide-binding universal stress UspA family protein
MRKILLAMDGSDHAQRALELAVIVAKATGSELTILNVATEGPITEGERLLVKAEYAPSFRHALDMVPPPLPLQAADPIPGGPSALIRPELPAVSGAAMRQELGEQIVQQAAAMAKSEGVGKVDTVVEYGDPARVIVRQAEELKADMTFLGSRGLGDLQGLLLGSVSHKVAHAARGSVVIVK